MIVAGPQPEHSIDPACAFCGCPLSRHCKGGESHGSHKEDARMVGNDQRRQTTICTTRHCLVPLCCCPDFQG